ncbi:PEP-CTERM sorting domain-containing protein [Massilia sp. G4R7]|uniref:PEP-CTERM sorting domain-containing protein n=1 Tax=Massilia phyllostachyos TaxID=2898585 RepID=A0ABS8Q287_9BURK|nr:PEP-CTERM sorting domain-containing protein [Massilia phyllostachyos]MCD2515845.1 PEP-CTERM sorting domain-containing protein [Massilia phyllostachyos]
MKAMTSFFIAAIMTLASAAAHAELIVTDTTYRDYDKSFGYVSFNVTSHGTINDVNVAVEFSKCDNPYIDPEGSRCIGQGTPFENEIVMRLIGPDGRVVNLIEEDTFDQGDTAGIGRITMTFTDEGQALGKRVQAGAFRPLGQLSMFDGMDMFGEWRLYVEDTFGSDPLEVFSSSLIFNSVEPPPADVPEPGSLAVFGAGMFALGALRRRQRRAI